MLEQLVQIIGDDDINRWSRVHPRYKFYDGCIVDLGCLMWDWSSYFFNKKRVIGADPQQTPHPLAEFYKGCVSSFSGKATLVGSGNSAIMKPDITGDVDVLCWNDFKKLFNISNIAILKINIEGGEYKLIKSFERADFECIDQIAISFHDWLNSDWKNDTDYCVKKIIDNNFTMLDLEIYGWKLFIKTDPVPGEVRLCV